MNHSQNNLLFSDNGGYSINSQQQPTTVVQTENSINCNDANFSHGYINDFNDFNDFSMINDTIFQAPCANTAVTSGNYVTNAASTSSHAPQYIIGHANERILGQNPPQQSIESDFPPLNFNITIHSPQTNLSEIFRFGFKITIKPISSPDIQFQQNYTYSSLNIKENSQTQQ